MVKRRVHAFLVLLLPLATTDLVLGNRRDPAEEDIETNDDGANGVERLTVVRGALCSDGEAEDDGEDDATEVTRGADDTADDTVCMGVDVRDEAVVEAVAALEEEGEAAAHEADERGLVVRVHDADDDHEDAGDCAVDVQEHLLAPYAAGLAVGDVGDDAAEGTADDVEETEHGGPVARVLEGHGGEVRLVVGAEDAVDRELGAESAEVAGCDG